MSRKKGAPKRGRGTHDVRPGHSVDLNFQVVRGYVNQVHINRGLEVDRLVRAQQVPNLVNDVVNLKQVLVPQCEDGVEHPVSGAGVVRNNLLEGKSRGVGM